LTKVKGPPHLLWLSWF